MLMTRTASIAVAVLAGALLAAGCSDGSPTSPSTTSTPTATPSAGTTNIAGAWTVTVAASPICTQIPTALRRRAVGSLDVVVATRGGASMGRELRRVLARTRTGVVVVAGDGRIGGLPGRVVSVGAAPVTIRAGPFVVVVSSEPRGSGAATLVADVRRSW